MNELQHSRIYNLIQEIIYNGNNLDFPSLYKELKIGDKEYFHKIILENKIAPSFIDYINNKDYTDLIFKNFYERCKIQARRYQIHSLQVVKEVREINNIFAKEGLKPIYLKGIALQKEYEDSSLRPMVDIDILFKQEELLKAYEALHKNNFLDSKQKQYLDKNNIDDFCRRYHHIYIITKNNISIELHHRVTKPADFINCPISKSFFDDFCTTDYFNERVNIPSIENTIIHLLCHFSINSSFKKLLRTLIDIKCINLNHEIKWKEIILKYDDVKIRKGISLSLELINLNKGSIQNLDSARTVLYKYFPKKELVQEAQHKLYDISSPNSVEIFLDRLRNPKYLMAVAGMLIPSKNMLKFRYKIRKSNFRSYVKYYSEQFGKILSVFLNIKKSSRYLWHTNNLKNWLNKDK